MRNVCFIPNSKILTFRIRIENAARCATYAHEVPFSSVAMLKRCRSQVMMLNHRAFASCHRFDCRDEPLRCLAASSLTSLSTSSRDSTGSLAELSSPTARYPPSSLSSCNGVTGPGLPIGTRRGLSGPSSCTGVDDRAAAEIISRW